MKKLPLIAVFLVCLGLRSQAGVFGWLTAEPRDWNFIQSVGGIAIDPVTQRAGKPMLPVTCDVSGLTAVTCRPTTMNSGLVLRTFDVKHAGKDITIRAVTSVPEGKTVSQTNYIDLSKIRPGTYDVYYPKKENGKLARLLQMTEDQEHGNIGGADSGSPRG